MSGLNRTDSAQKTVSFVLMGTADQEARSLISKRLDQYNDEYTGVSDNTPLDVLIFDGTSREMIGGLVGRTSLGVLFVNYLYLPDSLRGKGHGSHVLAMAEAEAIRRGCAKAVLFTMAIQAPLFYEKRGYETFGRVDCDPPGNARIFMRKELRRSRE